MLDLYPGYEDRTLEEARKAVVDIPPCARADYNIRWANGAPILVIAFTDPEVVMVFQQGQAQPAVAIRLACVPRPGSVEALLDPLRPGKLLEGDKLRRHVRESVEHYLTKHGIRLPDMVFGREKGSEISN